MKNTSEDQKNEQISSQFGSFNQQISHELLSIMEKEEIMENITRHQIPLSTSQRITNEAKSILVSRLFVELLQFIDPFSLPIRIHKFKALKSILPMKTALFRFFEPNFLLSNLLYQTVKFPLFDETLKFLSTKYSSTLCYHPSLSIILNYTAGGLAAAIAQPVKILYNSLFYPKQFFENPDAKKIDLLKSRFSLQSKFIQHFACFFQSKVIFGSLYFGTFTSLNSLPQKQNNSTLLCSSLASSLVAQIFTSPFEKATYMLLRSQNAEFNFTMTYSHCLSHIMSLYKKEPQKMFEIGGRQIHRLLFNTILIGLYDKMKVQFSQSH